jgi:hypothetical protein
LAAFKATIGETARIMASLKRLMRARAITYGQLSRRSQVGRISCGGARRREARPNE